MPHPNHPEAARPAIFTQADIEKMRLYVLEHDKLSAVNVFDLNNPPKQPYTHQDYPRVVNALHKEGHQIHKIVNDADEHKAALAAGWSDDQLAPAPTEELGVEAAAVAEAAAVDRQLAAGRRKK